MEDDENVSSNSDDPADENVSSNIEILEDEKLSSDIEWPMLWELSVPYGLPSISTQPTMGSPFAGLMEDVQSVMESIDDEVLANESELEESLSSSDQLAVVADDVAVDAPPVNQPLSKTNNAINPINQIMIILRFCCRHSAMRHCMVCQYAGGLTSLLEPR